MTLKQLINFDTLSFDRICEKIRNGEHFSLARYGDGEFNAILGVDGANCDGHEYFPDMGKDLGGVLKSAPDYYLGLHQNNRNGLQEKTIDWILGEKIEDLKWVSNAVFHCAVRDGLMGQFWEALENKEVIIIGPEYIRKQSKAIADHIMIPGRQTYHYWKKGTSNIDYIKNWPNVFTGKIVLISASMTAPLIVDHLHQQYGNQATFIDFGSTFDPFCGVQSRSFHKNLMQ